MLTAREKTLIAAVATVIVIVYSLAWIHENPFVTGSSLQNTTLRPVVVQADGSAISSVLGNWTDLGMVHREYGGSHIEVFITFESKAIKTVYGSEVLIDGLLGVEVLSKSRSVEVTDVTVDMITGKNVWLGDLLPDDYTGFTYFKAAEPYVVQFSCYNADANREACMEALLQRHNWGGKLVFYTWPDFSVNGNPPDYAGRATFRVMVEYLVRKGAFTAKKMKTVIEIPAELDSAE